MSLGSVQLWQICSTTSDCLWVCQSQKPVVQCRWYMSVVCVLANCFVINRSVKLFVWNDLHFACVDILLLTIWYRFFYLVPLMACIHFNLTLVGNCLTVIIYRRRTLYNLVCIYGLPFYETLILNYDDFTFIVSRYILLDHY